MAGIVLDRSGMRSPIFVVWNNSRSENSVSLGGDTGHPANASMTNGRTVGATGLPWRKGFWWCGGRRWRDSSALLDANALEKIRGQQQQTHRPLLDKRCAGVSASIIDRRHAEVQTHSRILSAAGMTSELRGPAQRWEHCARRRASAAGGEQPIRRSWRTSASIVLSCR
jgi:hypothetical protein